MLILTLLLMMGSYMNYVIAEREDAWGGLSKLIAFYIARGGIGQMIAVLRKGVQ